MPKGLGFVLIHIRVFMWAYEGVFSFVEADLANDLFI